VRTTFFTILSGTAARRGAPASYLEVRAAHPRKSGTVRFNLSAISADLPTCAGCHVTHQHIVTIGVVVTVHYQPGAHPTWRTAVRFGRPFPRTPVGGGGSDHTGLGGGNSPAGSGGSCSGLDCGDTGLGGGDAPPLGGGGDAPPAGGSASCSGLDC
jgi:hypothetical protein